MPNQSEVSNWKYSHFLKNERNKFDKNDILRVLPKQEMDEAFKVISKWNNYSQTPLIYLNKSSVACIVLVGISCQFSISTSLFYLI